MYLEYDLVKWWSFSIVVGHINEVTLCQAQLAYTRGGGYVFLTRSGERERERLS